MAENKKKAKVQEDEPNVLDNIDASFNRGEAFIEQNQSKILIGLGIVALVVIAVICFKSFYLTPRQAEANDVIAPAEQMFMRDSFQVALNGNEEVVGFLEIIDDYGSTEAGNVAKAFAGLCYKKLGNNEEAIKYLEKFSAKGNIVQPAILGAIGDAYWDMKNVDKAISYYKKAASADNEMMTPVYNKRIAIAYMAQNQNDKAMEMLQSIEKNYPSYPEMMEVKKLIEYIKGK